MLAVLSGLFMVMLGVEILYVFEYLRRGRSVEGVILGVRRRGPSFFNVYQYMLPDGATGEATSVQGGASLSGRETGRRVPIYVVPGYPQQALDTSSPEALALAFAFIVFGVVFMDEFGGGGKLGKFAWAFIAIVALLLGRTIWRRLLPYLAKVQSQMGSADAVKTAPVETADSFYIPPSPASSRGVSLNSAQTAAVVCVIGVVTLTLAGVLGSKLLRLSNGAKTTGNVVRLQQHKNRWYPQVSFTDTKGAAVLFWDQEASDTLRVGDRVPVLYLSQEEDTAMIDSGLHKWRFVVLLLALATIFMTVGVHRFRAKA